MIVRLAAFNLARVSLMATVWVASARSEDFILVLLSDRIIVCNDIARILLLGGQEFRLLLL